MTLGTIITDVLPHLHAAELSNDPRPQQKTNKKGRQAGINGPKGNVSKYIKYRQRRMQWI
jgi:hypothetical protein